MLKFAWIPIAIVSLLLLSGCGETAVRADSRTPAACVDAIATARELFDVSADAFGYAAVYPGLIQDAAESGALQDADGMDQIARTLRRTTRKVNRSSSRMDRLGDRFNTYAAECELRE